MLCFRREKNSTKKKKTFCSSSSGSVGETAATSACIRFCGSKSIAEKLQSGGQRATGSQQRRRAQPQKSPQVCVCGPWLPLFCVSYILPSRWEQATTFINTPALDINSAPQRSREGAQSETLFSVQNKRLCHPKKLGELFIKRGSATHLS